MKVVIRFHSREGRDLSIPRLRKLSVFSDVSEVVGLKTTALAKLDEGDLEAAELALASDDAVMSWAPDHPVRLTAAEDVSFTLGRHARQQAVEATQFFHYYNNDRTYPDWGSLPTDITFQRESNRLGSNIHMAVIDTGVEAGHAAEFGGRVVDVHAEYGDADGNHGTGVGSVMAGAECGFCPEAQVLNCKALSTGGGGGISNVVTTIGALVTWMETGGNIEAGEHVVANMSIVTQSYNAYQGAITDLEDAGGTLFVSAGNEGQNIDGSFNIWPPETHHHATVGAVDARGFRTHFSNYGTAVRFYGLGWHVPAARADGTYGYQAGTSFSSPAVAGCYGTWLADRTPATSRAEVLANLDEFFANFCKPGLVRNRAGSLVPLSHARLGRACRLPV